MSATVKRRDFVRRSRIDVICPGVHGSMTIYCDIEDEPYTVQLFVADCADCEAIA